jgi:hypothetical protein
MNTRPSKSRSKNFASKYREIHESLRNNYRR